MAVIIKYVVVRDGVEKMTFTTKKEADAYDKMLDIAENLHAFIGSSELPMPDELLEPLSLYLAEHRDLVGTLLKGGNLDVNASAADKKAKADKAEDTKPAAKKAARSAKSKA